MKGRAVTIRKFKAWAEQQNDFAVQQAIPPVMVGLEQSSHTDAPAMRRLLAADIAKLEAAKRAARDAAA